MIVSAKFWMQITVFQIIFGLAIFAVTRQYYKPDAQSVSVDPIGTRAPDLVWPERIAEIDMAELGSPATGELSLDDPIEISRQANKFFAEKQYDRAAEFYTQLLPFDERNVDTYNNLGITLHYLGRSDEALVTLNEGVAIDPGHQRIRLTLGFVNSQLGNVEAARAALATAVEMGADNEVGRSAAKMLGNLP